MKKSTLLLWSVAMAFILGAGAWLTHYRTHQRLGLPGVKTHRLPNSELLEVDLPETVLYYDSERYEVDALTKGTLPPDTSFGFRQYKSPDGFRIQMNAVLMGSDRTSLHKPQFCLEGQGMHIDASRSVETTVHIQQPCAYDLPIVKLIANGQRTIHGQTIPVRGVYVYWYVADGALSATISGGQRMFWMFRELLRTGVLQRWAYISCYTECDPGREDAAFERVKQFIADAVPQFQLTPQGPAQVRASATGARP